MVAIVSDVDADSEKGLRREGSPRRAKLKRELTPAGCNKDGTLCVLFICTSSGSYNTMESSDLKNARQSQLVFDSSTTWRQKSCFLDCCYCC
jgi:hypothetical protein